MSRKKTQKPIWLQRFEKFFDNHPAETFMPRPHITQKLNTLLNVKSPASPYVFLVGESGTGKTAFMVNQIRPVRNKIVYYFFEYDNPVYHQSSAFTKQLYRHLCWIYKFDIEDIRRVEDSDVLDLLQATIYLIGRKCLKEHRRQEIFIEAIDECLMRSSHSNLSTVLDVLKSLKFPNTFRIIVSSARRIDELDIFVLPKDGNIISLSGTDEDNQADVKAYFVHNLPLKKNSQEDLTLLVSRSEGNFQYAFLAVGMVERKEVDIKWLLQSPPRGLRGIYKEKLQRVEDTVLPDRYALKSIWEVIGLISFLRKPSSPDDIIDTLEIDQREKKHIFRHIEQFLDLSLYKGKHKKCGWFHRSFCDYLYDDLDIIKLLGPELGDKIVKHIVQNVTVGKMPNMLLSGVEVPGYFFLSNRNKEVLRFMRFTFMPFWSDKEEVGSIFERWLTAFMCLSSARKEISPLKREVCEHYGFFALLQGVLHDHIFDNKDVRRVALKEKEIVRAKTERFRGLSRSEIHALLSKSVELTDNIAMELDSRVDDIRVMLADEFEDVEQLVAKCEHYVKEWFPPDSDTEPKEKADTVPVLLNGESKRMECRKVDEYKEKGSAEFSILIDIQNERVWYFKKLVSVKDDAYKFLCLLAEQPQGKIKYERIYYRLWKLKPDLKKVRKPMLDRIQKLLDRGIWKKQEGLKKHIVIDPGIGVKFTEGTTVLVILKQVYS